MAIRAGLGLSGTAAALGSGAVHGYAYGTALLGSALLVVSGVLIAVGLIGFAALRKKEAEE